MPASRRTVLATLGLSALAGCTGRQPGSADDTAGDAGPTTEGSGSGGDGAVTAALPTADEPLTLSRAPESFSDAAESGGPPKDGIPSVDDPQFVAPDAVDFLDPGDPVFGVARDGDVKAYPQKILVHHEIVNDDLAGTPVSVTYCPLTGTVQGFERGETTFGVSGRLINNNLVMYDRATEAWWPQVLATSIPGPWNEDPEIQSLREFRLVWTTWERWRDHHPDTVVLSTDTGSARNYGQDPYGRYNPPRGYYANEVRLFDTLVDDDRFHPKEVFMGARTSDGAVAFRKAALRDKRLVDGTLGGTPALAVYDDRYDTGYVYLNPGEAAFEWTDNRVVDGSGTAHAPDDLPLTRVHTFDAMWFAWVGFYPETDVYE